MANELPYLPSYKNVGLLFDKIKTAKIPEIFTQKFLYETIGIKGAGDRPLINLLKNLSFLESSGKPTPRYSALKNEKIAGIEIARGLKEAYKPLFDANEKAYNLTPNDLKGLVAQVSGSDTQTVTKIVGTFKALLAISDFDSEAQLLEDIPPPKGIQEIAGTESIIKNEKRLKPEFHYNIQVHLPSNGNEETYMNIFNAIRKVFNE